MSQIQSEVSLPLFQNNQSMKNKIPQSLQATTLVAIFLFFGKATVTHAGPDIYVDNKITGGTSSTGGYYLDNTGRLLVSSTPFSGGLPAIGSAILFFNPATYSLFVGPWDATAVANPPGNFSTSLGRSTSPGGDSLANGVGCSAIGLGSTALGAYAYALGMFSVAIGEVPWAGGESAVALGRHLYANGTVSAAFGEETSAGAYACFVIGRYNKNDDVSPTGATNWNSGDPIFEIGIGSDELNRKNALTVKNDGTIIIPKAQGDILMGEFGNPP